MYSTSTPLRTALLLRAAPAAILLILGAAPLMAETARCSDAADPQPAGCKRANADVVVTMPPGENTEFDTRGPGGNFDKLGFSISIDQKTVAGAPAPKDSRRTDDIAAARGNVDIRYDGLDHSTILNVSTNDLRASYRGGDRVTFRTTTNYPHYLRRAEVLITDTGKPGEPVVATLPVAPNGSVSWTMPASGGSGNYSYVLRVYDSAGRYDETVPLDLHRSAEAFARHATSDQPIVAAGEGEDRTRLRNIPIRGGRVTVFGERVEPGSKVRVGGEPVPLDPSGRFVASRILPAGPQVVDVEITGKDGRSRTYKRAVTIPKSDWFGVGIVDLTFGATLHDDVYAADPDAESTGTDGRLAFYGKGRTQGGYTITTSIDTGEGSLKDAFRRLSDKDPRKVLMRLDPFDTYPTYGDDSKIVDDAPTSGRFYLRIERNASSFLWGDFKSRLAGTRYLDSARALYGAELRLVSPSATKNGDPKGTATLYAAQPDTLPQRDILRGTGGSIYFLSHQDVGVGTETVTVQVVDPVTGRVISTRTLTEGVDYRIDYMQGLITLTAPLQTNSAGGGLISDPSTTDDVNLVVQYEYTPTTGSVDGISAGGRVEYWLAPNLRLGLTATKDSTGSADQIGKGADLHLRLGKASFIEAEVARTEGPGFGRALSTDGGLTITSGGVSSGSKANAYRFETRLDFGDMGLSTPGHLNLYYGYKQAGFSTVTTDVLANQTDLALSGEIEATSRLSFGAEVERFSQDGGNRRNTAEVHGTYKIDDTWSVELGAAYLDRRTLGFPAQTGKRTDIGARLNYRRDEDHLYYVFGQTTAQLSGGVGRNDRLGAGFDVRLSEKVGLAAHVSGGAKGPGAGLKLRYSPTADNEVTLGYTLDPLRELDGYPLVGRDRGKVIFGTRFKRSDTITTFTENSFDNYGERQTLANAYGVTYTPSALWSWTATAEVGRVHDPVNGDFDRRAYSLGTAYSDADHQSGKIRLEYRRDSGGVATQNTDTWAMTAGYEYRLNPNWRFLSDLNALYTESSQANLLNGEYLRARVGYAYRPIDNDRLNLLFRYTFLRDMPGADQVGADGTTNSPRQISHVLSVDANYDLNDKLTIGGKYGFRLSKVADRTSPVFSASTAHLAVVRLDWHVVHKWDMLAEGRTLYTLQDRTWETGALFGVYRHVGNNAKIGVGYQWGHVSDDMTDLGTVRSGVFLNVVSKF